MQQNILRAAIVVSVLLSVIAIACTRNMDMDVKSDLNGGTMNLGADRDVFPPAYYIQMSEKLQIPQPVDLPADLPNGNSRVITLFAEGVQKYRAQQKAGSDPVAYEWVFVAPQADLFDITNKKVGVHAAGPTWQLFGNGDFIHAQHFTPQRTASASDSRTIDWLQLMPKTGTIPTGIFSDVDYIQRIATDGGKAPLTLPISLTETAEVKYKAIYRFSKKN